MKWTITKNNKPIKLKDISLLDITSFRTQAIKHIQTGMRPVLFFGVKGKSIPLYLVLADDDNSRLYIAGMDLGTRNSYPSIAADVPSLWNFENEICEEFGIIPEGHPWPRPVRFQFDRKDRSNTMSDFPFFLMKGDEVHEVGVGPIHAGVIEPGHFRFMCHGENVHHLEIQLGYQHRGVENLFKDNILRFPVHLAESITGDSVIAHASAYVHAMEGLAEFEASRRAQSIRAIALEMERAAIHIGDLSAISNDIAFLLGSSVFGALRTQVINALLRLCGSRFGRGLVRVGGVLYDITDERKEDLRATLTKVRTDVERMSESMFLSGSTLSRLEETGIVDSDTAAAIGLVGLSARASGLSRDVRSDQPFGIYRYYPVHKITMNGGDVFCRAYLRYVEIIQSINFILEQLDEMQDEKIFGQIKKIEPNSFIASMTESWRGEVAHAAITGAGGRIVRYKVKDPSFHNWLGLAMAVRKNGISDFPLCNKSFNLSYAGHDL